MWVYNKALINLEFGPFGKYLLEHNNIPINAEKVVQHDAVVGSQTENTSVSASTGFPVIV